MKISLQRILVLGILNILSGCAASSYVSEIRQKELSPLHLAFQVQEVEIMDSRPNQAMDIIKLPIISKPNTLIRHVPALTSLHRQLIEKVVKENTTNSGIPVKTVINIPDGYQEFSSTWSTEKEKGFAQVQVSLINQETGELIAAGDSSGELYVQSADATNKRMEEIYQLTIKNVIYNCLKSISGQVEK